LGLLKKIHLKFVKNLINQNELPVPKEASRVVRPFVIVCLLCHFSLIISKTVIIYFYFSTINANVKIDNQQIKNEERKKNQLYNHLNAHFVVENDPKVQNKKNISNMYQFQKVKEFKKPSCC
jgi:hypothetical protein